MLAKTVMASKLQRQVACASGSARGGAVKVHASAAAVDAPKKLKAASRVKLGDSDLLVSACCLGTMTWGQQNTEAEGHAQLNHAWDMGINFLDAAEMYPVPTKAETQGATERIIGTWLKTRKREDVVVATKVSGFGDRLAYVRTPPRTTRVTPDQIREAVDKSLQRLQTDHIDLLQIHWPDRYVGGMFGQPAYDIKLERKDDIPFEEQLRGLQDVVQAGKVRYVGVSNETSYGVSEFVRVARELNLPKIVSIQNSYSLLTRGAFETDLAEMCRRHNVALLPYSPLAAGTLSGKYNKPNLSPEWRLNLFPGYMERYKQSRVREAVLEYEKLAAKHGLTPTQLALAWVHSRWFVHSTIIGATTVEQLKENVAAFDVELSDEVLAGVNTVYKQYRDPSYV